MSTARSLFVCLFALAVIGSMAAHHQNRHHRGGSLDTVNAHPFGQHGHKARHHHKKHHKHKKGHQHGAGSLHTVRARPAGRGPAALPPTR